MSKPFRIWLSIFRSSTTPGLPSFPLSLANRMAASTASRCTYETRSKSVDLITHLPSRLSTMNWISTAILVEPAEDPDEKDDRDGYTDQPQQKTSTHSFLLYRWFSHLTAALNLGSNRCQGREYRCAVAARRSRADGGCAHGARVNGPRRSVCRDRLWNLARAATLLWQDENLIPSPEETPHGETCLCFNPVRAHDHGRERASPPAGSSCTATSSWPGRADPHKSSCRQRDCHPLVQAERL